FRVRRSHTAARLIALLRVALNVALQVAVELTWRALLCPLQVALRRALEGAVCSLEILEILRVANLLAQRRVLELNGAAVSGIEWPVAGAFSLSEDLGGFDLFVWDDMDGARPVQPATAIAITSAPIVMAPQRRTDDESNAKADHRGAD